MGKDYVMRRLVIYTYCSCDQMENNEMSGDCSTYGREETCIQGFGGET